MEKFTTESFIKLLKEILTEDEFFIFMEKYQNAKSILAISSSYTEKFPNSEISVHAKSKVEVFCRENLAEACDKIEKHLRTHGYDKFRILGSWKDSRAKVPNVLLDQLISQINNYHDKPTNVKSLASLIKTKKQGYATNAADS